MAVEPWEILGDAIASKLGLGRINLATGKRMIGGGEGRWEARLLP